MKNDVNQRVFFTCYGGGHSAALIPVLTLLRNLGISTAALALTTAKASFDRAHLPSLGMNDLLGLVPEYRRVRVLGKYLAKTQAANSSVAEEETAAYLGVGFHALVKEHGMKGARSRYEKSGRQAFKPVDFFLRLFETNRPTMVVATSAPRSERAVFEAARQLAIPSVCVVDLFAPYEIEWCASKDYASAYCVLNEAVKDRFIRAGVPAERIFVTGNPSFDRLSQVDKAQVRRVAREKLALKESDRLVAWISQPEPAQHPFSLAQGDPAYPQNVERALAAYFGDSPSVNLVMRLHPSESRLPAVTGARIRYSDSSEPLDELLCAADCIITASSTVGLEAALLGVPVVQCMDSIFSMDLPLAALGLATAVPTYSEAGACAHEIMKRENLQMKLDYQCDGGSATRIADKIIELVL